MILEYKLDAGEYGMRCPPWIDDGGYWLSTDHTMVGVTMDNPEFHIPSTVLRLTPQELEDRQVAIHTAKPMMNFADNSTDEPVEMTEAEVRTMVQDWVTEKEIN
jgi:hypothetical protein